ncbi:hypothetical protein CO583_08650 [Parasaccharibacter sp. TMW2.1882]|uniref:Uncharacterized protein n=2 Tax=Acetobacteraceae TaxID=433 RepID=A0A7U7G506_9PROT|nr:MULTISPECIES: hypothetical protein [Acetobacteraceae]MCL1563259.1 hypothetical protein [Parasaccharibacter sp. TMW 2.1886]MCQ0042127.1 hypothetical protein [Bombella sp.]QGT75676.1 hypothetical protein GN304_08080 [Bombella sp. ESL0368]MBE1724488.1 hypothetical protein [Bombella apis]MBR9729719.1 hypothetical protein [Bombella apis]
MSGSDLFPEEEDRPAGPVPDSAALLEEGRRFQRETGIPPLLGHRPRFLPWVLLAALLMLVSLGIEIFWPLPGRHGPLPVCGQGAVETVSCQKPAAVPSAR